VSLTTTHFSLFFSGSAKLVIVCSTSPSPSVQGFTVLCWNVREKGRKKRLIPDIGCGAAGGEVGWQDNGHKRAPFSALKRAKTKIVFTRYRTDVAI
jgi:hypothetical protein